MNKNTKRVLSAITVASLSVTSFTGNIQNVVNAKEDKQEENALSTNRVNAEVLENEAGAVIRVSASSNVQNVKTTYSVDSAGSKVVSFGDLKAGEVREIQVNFEEDSNKLKSLPKTTAVSDRVDFNKEVRGHKIKGSVSFEYDNGDTAPVVTPTVPTTPTKPVVTPTVPTEPTKPVAPVVTTPSNPTEPTNPVATPTEPTTPTKPVVTPINPNTKKVNLRVNVHVTQDGEPRVLTVVVYEDVEAGTKVSLEHVKEVLKGYDYEVKKLEGFPAVLDKDYTVDVDAIFTKEPKKDEPTTPAKPVVTPTEPTIPITPNTKKVNLEVNVHVTQDGQPRVLTVSIYENVEVGTKVSLEHVKEVLKGYDYEVEKLEGFPAVLDRDYTVDVDAIFTKEPKKDEPTTPAKPVTPAVTPADTGLEAGMPANVKWSRAQLKAWGFTFGKITGDYKVDGDLGVFDNDDALDPAYRRGLDTIDDKIMDGSMSFDYAEKNTPHGYAWYSVTKPDGNKGYAMYLYGTDGKFNDGQKAR